MTIGSRRENGSGKRKRRADTQSERCEERDKKERENIGGNYNTEDGGRQDKQEQTEIEISKEKANEIMQRGVGNINTTHNEF